MSYTTDEFVLGGYIQSYDVWAEFEAASARLLPEFGVKAKNGVARFHMFDMEDRMKDVRRFSDVIDEHDLYPVSFRMNLDELHPVLLTPA